VSYSVDLFWSFRSPYCYLALDRLLAIHRDYAVEVNVRPIYPIAIRVPDHFKKISPLYRAYHTMDSKRLAEYLGIPFRRPLPDPIVMDIETGDIADDQPYIFPLTRLGMAAAMAGEGLPFIDRVSRMIWDGSVDGWNEGDHMDTAIRAAGLDPATLREEAEDNAKTMDDMIEGNQDAHAAAGHWGVPTFAFRGEAFFGQDRIDMLLWRMKQAGLKAR